MNDPIHCLKRHVADAIKRELERYYDPGAAVLMQTDRARVSDIRRGRLTRVSLETLIRYAGRLGVDVELQCQRRPLNSKKAAPETLTCHRTQTLDYRSVNISRIVRPGCTRPH